MEFVLMDSNYCDPGPYPRRAYDLHCPACGRYCKAAGTRYDHRSCLWVTTSCTKCGVVETPWG